MAYVIYFVITIAILVFIHELGHFLAAKLSGMRAEVFAIGFGKRLFGWNKITGFTWGELPKDFDGGDHTDYRLCLLPLGGYVKISGMIDESFDTKFASSEPKPYEFRAKSTPKKLFVITAGVLMNFLLALIIFWGINFFHGKQIIKTTTLGVIEEETIAKESGFKSYDKILSVNNVKVYDWEDVVSAFLIDNVGKNLNVKVERNGENVDLFISRSKIKKTSKSNFFLPIGNTSPIITDVMKDSPAMTAKIKAGDVILSIKDSVITSSKQVVGIISGAKNTPINMKLLRGKDTVVVSATPSFEGKIGVALGDVYDGPVDYKKYGFISAFSVSFDNMMNLTGVTYMMFRNVIAGNVEFNKVFGGPIKIAQFAAKTAENGIVSFLSFLAALSLSLAILNILPFPVLDGGHFVIILIEGLIRRELPIKVKIAIQNAGFVILMLLMVFIIYNDIISL
ncbi:MAG TPA: RIP metalloprotease RseP [Melioribacteraceae bacterium]|nr:RIP metalloprotease RseP [Melioribacteraceae bacterium]